MNESIPKRPRKRKRADDSAGQPQEPKRETQRCAREGSPELERAERRVFEGKSTLGHRNVEE